MFLFFLDKGAGAWSTDLGHKKIHFYSLSWLRLDLKYNLCLFSQPIK